MNMSIQIQLNCLWRGYIVLQSAVAFRPYNFNVTCIQSLRFTSISLLLNAFCSARSSSTHTYNSNLTNTTIYLHEITLKFVMKWKYYFFIFWLVFCVHLTGVGYLLRNLFFKFTSPSNIKHNYFLSLISLWVGS